MASEALYYSKGVEAKVEGSGKVLSGGGPLPLSLL